MCYICYICYIYMYMCVCFIYPYLFGTHAGDDASRPHLATLHWPRAAEALGSQLRRSMSFFGSHLCHLPQYNRNTVRINNMRI